MAKVSLQERQRMVERIEKLGPWFHNYELDSGVWTNPHGNGPGFDYPGRRWPVVSPLLPELDGKTCLDVGCSSGFFSLKLKELGAREVLGVDDGEQRRAIEQAKFAAEQLKLSVDFEERSIYQLRDLNRTFDLVVCLGVFYHLRHPLLALEQLRAACRGTLILQTITTRHNGQIVKFSPSREDVSLRDPVMEHPSFPTLRFIEGSLNGDSSCWFVPNPEAVESMLRACRFSVDEIVCHGDAEVTVRCSAV
jgi:tRNA (mo5U34)-methyltransferase